MKLILKLSMVTALTVTLSPANVYAMEEEYGEGTPQFIQAKQELTNAINGEINIYRPYTEKALDNILQYFWRAKTSKGKFKENVEKSISRRQENGLEFSMPWKLNSPKIFTYSDFEKFKLPTIQYFFMNKHSNSVSLNVNSPASCFDHISSDSGSLIQNDGRRKQLTQNLQEKRKPIFIQDNLQMDIGLLSPELKEIRRDKKIDLIKPLTLPQLDLNSYSISLLDNKPLDLGVGLEKRFKKIADIEPLHKFVEKITPSESDSSLDSDIDVD